MEKQVDERVGDLSVEERCTVHFGEYKETKHHSIADSADKGSDDDGKQQSTPCETTHSDGETLTGPPSHDDDAGGPRGHTDPHVKQAHDIEDAGMTHEPGETSSTHEKHEYNSEHASLAHEPAVHGQQSPRNEDTDITCGQISHVMDVATTSNEHMENSAAHSDEHLGSPHGGSETIHIAHDKAPHGDEHVGLSHESGEIHKTHGKMSDDIEDAESLVETAERPTTRENHSHGNTEMDLTPTSKANLTHVHGDEAGHASHALKDHALSDAQEKTIDHITGEKSAKNEKVVCAGVDVGVSRDHENIQKHDVSDAQEKTIDHITGEKSATNEKVACAAVDVGVSRDHENIHKHDIRSGTSHDYAEKYRVVDDECESKKSYSDENSSREGVQFSIGSTDVDTPTQGTSTSFGNTKSSKAGQKGVGVAEKGPGSVDGNLETPAPNWAFSTRASIAPSKFDHMATLRMTYAAYKESNNGKEGVPLSLLPEILESARFMVPPPRDLVPLLQRIDIDYKAGNLIRWSLLQNLVLQQIERKEVRYPPVFIPRPSVARPNSNSPNSWKAQQRSPTRRTHPEDDCPELEPQVYEMMKEIDNHRRKSAKEGNYLAADAAAQRLLELKLFEDNKRRATMLERHAQEREQAEKAYKGELQERNQLWDERLKNFQREVVEHAQRLKQQHIAALQHFKEKMASKTPVKAQWSRELLKQRRIQVYLGKQGKYLEAQEVKQSADRMEQAELQAAIAGFQSEVIGREQTVRVKQQTEMDILLQRAARTREEIRKSRTLDLQRCHQRHKNVMRELAAIQKQEVFRFDQLMQKKVQNPYTGVGFGGQCAPQSSSSRPARIAAPDYSTDDGVYSGEDSSMKD